MLQRLVHLKRVQDAKAFISGAKRDDQWDDAWGVLLQR